jgi:hypothetical protein
MLYFFGSNEERAFPPHSKYRPESAIREVLEKEKK